MNYKNLFIHTKQDFENIWHLITNAINLKNELPHQIFNPPYSNFALEEFDWAMSGDFWESLQKLAILNNDSTVFIATLDPEPESYFYNHFSYYNVACIPVISTKDDYWNLLNLGPQKNTSDCMFVNSFTVVWFPPSLKWVILGTRVYSSLILAFANKEIATASQEITNTWIPLDDMIRIIGLNFKNQTIPKDFEQTFKENYKNSPV